MQHNWRQLRFFSKSRYLQMTPNGRQLQFFKVTISTYATQWETTPIFQSNDIYKCNTMGDNSNFSKSRYLQMQHNGRQLQLFKVTISTNATHWGTTPIVQSHDIYICNTMGDNSSFSKK